MESLVECFACESEVESEKKRRGGEPASVALANEQVDPAGHGGSIHVAEGG